MNNDNRPPGQGPNTADGLVDDFLAVLNRLAMAPNRVQAALAAAKYMRELIV